MPYAQTAPPQPLSPGIGGDAAQSELMSQLSTLDRLQFETAQARALPGLEASTWQVCAVVVPESHSESARLSCI